MVTLGKKGESKEHTGIRLTKEQLEWLRRKVREGEFASVSHGIRRCIDLVREMKTRNETKTNEECLRKLMELVK